MFSVCRYIFYIFMKRYIKIRYMAIFLNKLKSSFRLTVLYGCFGGGEEFSVDLA